LRYLGIGDTCDLGDFHYRLDQVGHEVRVYIAMPEAQDIFAQKVVVPNIRYRNDIGNRVIEGDYSRLKALGYIT
jgi:hypothetical protein